MQTFLLDSLSGMLAPATFKIYVDANYASHIPIVGAPVGRHPRVSHILCGNRWLRLICRPWIPSWDLAVVLEELSEAHFEHLKSTTEKLLALIVGHLLALSSLKNRRSAGPSSSLLLLRFCSWMLFCTPDWTTFQRCLLLAYHLASLHSSTSCISSKEGFIYYV